MMMKIDTKSTITLIILSVLVLECVSNNCPKSNRDIAFYNFGNDSDREAHSSPGPCPTDKWDILYTPDDIPSTDNELKKYFQDFQICAHCFYFYGLTIRYYIDNITVPEDVTGKFTFLERIIVEGGEDKNSLQFKNIRIHKEAFKSSFETVKDLYLHINPVQEDGLYSTLNLVNSFRNLEYFKCTGSFKIIPDKAFQLKKLLRLYLTTDQLIGSPFYNLDNIYLISLNSSGHGGGLNYISNKTFKFANRYLGRGLELQFGNNSLNGSSFQVGAFDHIKGYVEVDLDNNNIGFLEKRVFYKFLMANNDNKITVGENPINCSDCRNYWMVEKKYLLGNMIFNIYCTDKNNKRSKSIWDSEKEFSECKYDSLNQEGINFIKKVEGFCALFYDDNVGCRSTKHNGNYTGIKTIGYGHGCHVDPNKCTDIEEPITEEEGEKILIKDLDEREDCVARYVNVKISRNQFTALVSFAFNTGCTTLHKSKLLEYVNENNFKDAAEEFINQGKNESQGIKNRREAEKKMFCQGIIC